MRSVQIVAAALIGCVITAPVGAATIQIVMENLEIKPSEVSTKVDDIVEWINKDVFAHTATARNGDFDVGLPPNKTVSFVLKKAGVVNYYCRFHPNMNAKLKIEP